MEFMKPKTSSLNGINEYFIFVKPFPYPAFLVHTSGQTHISQNTSQNELSSIMSNKTDCNCWIRGKINSLASCFYSSWESYLYWDFWCHINHQQQLGGRKHAKFNNRRKSEKVNVTQSNQVGHILMIPWKRFTWRLYLKFSPNSASRWWGLAFTRTLVVTFTFFKPGLARSGMDVVISFKWRSL